MLICLVCWIFGGILSQTSLPDFIWQYESLTFLSVSCYRRRWIWNLEYTKLLSVTDSAASPEIFLSYHLLVTHLSSDILHKFLNASDFKHYDSHYKQFLIHWINLRDTTATFGCFFFLLLSNKIGISNYVFAYLIVGFSNTRKDFILRRKKVYSISGSCQL
jgi:hypothetical protein